MNVNDWLEEIYSSYEKSPNKAGMQIYETVIPMLFDEQNFSGVDEILSKVDVNRVNPLIAVAFLTSSNTHRDFLKEYAPYFGRVEAKITAEIPERRERILVGLSPRTLG